MEKILNAVHLQNDEHHYYYIYRDDTRLFLEHKIISYDLSDIVTTSCSKYCLEFNSEIESAISYIRDLYPGTANYAHVLFCSLIDKCPNPIL